MQLLRVTRSHRRRAVATGAYVLATWLLRALAEGGVLAVLAGLLYLVVPVTVVVLAARTARRLRSSGWWYLTTAAVVWVASAIAEETMVGADNGDSFPGVTDYGYVAVLPLLMVGTWKLSHDTSGLREQLRSLFDGLLISTSLVLVFWWVALGTTESTEMGTFGTIVALSYLFGDILVVTTVRSSREYEAPDRVDMRIFSLAFVVLAVGDAVFAYQINASSFDSGALVPEFFWLGGFMLCVWAIEFGREHSGGIERRRVGNVYLFGSLGAALCVTVGGLSIDGGIDPVHAWGLVLLSAIAAARQLVSQSENDELRARLEQQLVALSRSEQRFRGVFDGIVDGVAVVDSDARLTVVNRSLAELIGRPAHELIGVDAITLLEPEDLHLIGEATIANGELNLATAHLRTAADVIVPVETTVSNQANDPAVGGFVVTVRDITERLRRQQELNESKERFRRSFEAAPIGMALVSSDGTILEANEAYAGMIGLTVDQVSGVHVRRHTHPDDVEPTHRQIEDLIASDGGSVRLEKRFVHADGHYVWGSLTVSVVRLPDGDHELVNQVEDITDRRAAMAQLAHNARHDGLTGLPNRADFEEALAQALTHAATTETFVAVAFLDVDRFKVVNDNLGHRSGDDLLKAVAARLRDACRAGDLVARFGGDEFTALFRNVADEDTARAVVDRLVRAISRPIELADGETFVSFSVGLTMSNPQMGASAVDLMLRNADAAMYRAKEAGRDRVEVHNHDSLTPESARRG